MQCTFFISEIAIHFPSFSGNSYLIHRGLTIIDSNLEISVLVKTTHPFGTLVYSNSTTSPVFFHLYVDDGLLKLQMSCDGRRMLEVESRVNVSGGQLTEIEVR